MGKNKLEEELIDGCLKNNRKSQKVLFEKYYAELFRVSLRYSDNKENAEDNLQESFLKIFNNIHQYSGKGSLINWMKKIVVNEALMKFRKKEQILFDERFDIDKAEYENIPVEEPNRQYSMEDVTNIIQKMPGGYRIVLTLYVYDKYSHKEIAKMLNISENTSKSQLSRARAFLRKELSQLKGTQSINLNRIIKSGIIGGLTVAYQNMI